MTTKVTTINFKGKPYVEVAERVRIVHEKAIDFEVLESEPLTIGDRVVWRVTIAVGGKTYKGCAEAKIYNAAPKSADATNPFECAETSAIGRALAFAGFGTVNGIASYDEVARGQPVWPEEVPTEAQLKLKFAELNLRYPDDNAKQVPWLSFVAKANGLKTKQDLDAISRRELFPEECINVDYLICQYQQEQATA